MKALRGERGSGLVYALVCSIILLGMVGALTMISINESEMVLDARVLEQSRMIAESGLNLVCEDYQKDQAAPPSDWYNYPQDFGNGTFQIIRDVDLGRTDLKRIVEIEAGYQGSTWGIEAVIGPITKPIWDKAIQANEDIAMAQSSQVDSWDSRVAPYNFLSPGSAGHVIGNGDIVMSQTSKIIGDLEVKGTITLNTGSSVAGTQTPGGDGVTLDSVDGLVAQMVTDLSAVNDNGTLNPSMVVMVGGQPTIEVKTNKTKTITSGDYYLGGINVDKNGNLLFDTSGGPIRIVVHTDDVVLASNADFSVTGTDPVYLYLTDTSKFEMGNLSNVTNTSGLADLFQVVINSTLRVEAGPPGVRVA